MQKDDDHRRAVEAWLDRCARGVPAQVARTRFEYAFNRLWAHTLKTLSDVTLVAVGERVLQSAADAYPWMAPCKLDGEGLVTTRLQETVESIEIERLRAGFFYALCEFMTILGVLTAEILTPGLHETLASIHPNDASSAAETHDHDDGTEVNHE